MAALVSRSLTRGLFLFALVAVRLCSLELRAAYPDLMIWRFFTITY